MPKRVLGSSRASKATTSSYISPPFRGAATSRSTKVSGSSSTPRLVEREKKRRTFASSEVEHLGNARAAGKCRRPLFAPDLHLLRITGQGTRLNSGPHETDRTSPRRLCQPTRRTSRPKNSVGRTYRSETRRTR